ncbi:MAG: cob(I)yrinic acid a,c-diamide adenosyltransferase [Thermoleophilia bacterium]|nr:cob(I)yrinic acid a,c-diamide adenosyltransferase [Thermoleophilia bacterium]
MSGTTHQPDSANERLFERGHVQIYTGDGKGKTTAAIGLAVRAVGAGLRVFIGQFMKMGSYSEIKALECFGEKIVCRQYGEGRWVRGRPSDEDIALAKQGLEEIRQLIASEEYDVVILDEIIMAVWFDLLETQDVIDLIAGKPAHIELVLTGRRANQELMDRADLVTEMCEIKHYYRDGVLARKGIES